MVEEARRAADSLSKPPDKDAFLDEEPPPDGQPSGHASSEEPAGRAGLEQGQPATGEQPHQVQTSAEPSAPPAPPAPVTPLQQAGSAPDSDADGDAGVDDLQLAAPQPDDALRADQQGDPFTHEGADMTSP